MPLSPSHRATFLSFSRQKLQTRHNTQQQGFTLLEMAVVLAIIALIISMSMTVGSKQIEQQQIGKTFSELKLIDAALSSYSLRHSRLPCPMRLDLTQADTNYGREHNACAASDAAPSGMVRLEYPASSGFFIRIGALPFKELSLGDDFAADEWNNRYLYAISEHMIDTIDTGEVGNITINDENNTAITDAALYALISHGADKEGGTDDERLATDSACDASDRDGDNCDNDGIFIDTQYNNGSVVGSFFDDIILWRTRARLAMR